MKTTICEGSPTLTYTLVVPLTPAFYDIEEYEVSAADGAGYFNPEGTIHSMRAEELEALLLPIIAQWTKHALAEPNQRIHCDWERDDGETCTQSLRVRFTLDNDDIITPSVVENAIGDLIAANEYLDEGNSELTVYRGNTVST